MNVDIKAFQIDDLAYSKCPRGYCIPGSFMRGTVMQCGVSPASTDQAPLHHRAYASAKDFGFLVALDPIGHSLTAVREQVSEL